MQLFINTLALSAAQVISRVANFVVVLYMTRYFGPEMYGTYLTIGSLQMVFGVIADFGLSNLIIKNVARDHALANPYAAACLPLRLFFSVAAFAGLLATGYLLNYPTETMFLLFLSGLSIPFASLSGVLTSVLAAYEKMRMSSAWDILTRTLTTLVNIGVLALGYGLRGVFLSSLIVSAAVFCCLMRFMLRRDLGGLKWRGMDKSGFSLGHLIYEAFPYLAVAVLGILHIRAEIVILSRCAGEAEVGWFGAALKPLEAVFVIPVSFLAASFPRISALFYRKSSQGIIAYYEKALRLMVTLAVPLTVVFLTSPGEILRFLYGPTPAPAAQAMAILSCVLLLSFVNSPVGNLIFASEHAMESLPFLVIGACVRLSLSVWLIFNMGYLGACFSLLTSEVLHFFINYYLINRLKIARLRLSFYIKPLWSPFLGGLIMAIYLEWPGNLGLPLLLVTGMLIYGMTMLFLWSLGRFFKSS